MKAFGRIFKYIWPQWPRLIVVFSTAIVVAILLSVSFMTIIPLMKVMLGQEGLHGWVDRKALDSKYGVNIYVPDVADITTGKTEDLAHSLLVTGVEKDSLAHLAGLKYADRIVGVGAHRPSGDKLTIAASKILEELATGDDAQIFVEVKRLDPNNVPTVETLTIHTPSDEDFISGLDWGDVRRTKWSLQLTLVAKAQWAVGFLPREQEQANKTDAVVFIIIAMGILTIIRCLAKFYQGYMAHKVMQIAITQMRQDVFSHAIEMPMGFFASERPTDTISRIIRDTNVMASSIKTMLGRALREPLNALFMLMGAMILSWQLVLIFLCMGPFVVGLTAFFGKKMKRATKKSLVAGSQMLAKLNGVMAGLKVVKVYNQQDHERDSFKTINSRLLKQLLTIAKVNAATSPTLEVFGMIGGSMAIVVGAHWISQSTTENRIEGTSFFVLLALLGAAAESVRKASGVWNRIQEANAAAERVFAVMDEPIEDESPDAPTLEPVKDKIEFVDIAFTYPGERAQVLKGVNLTVQAGHNVAIVGPNGSGKTTLANLVPRLYDPDSGQILIDGKDIREVSLVSLRDQIAMVTQNIVTFNDTITANIAYGEPGRWTDSEVVEAARAANALEFIEQMPDGFDSMLGDRGVRLSGGQRQRIGIARAILRDPPILILDEATSSLDSESESLIQTALGRLLTGRTVFVIAHRLSTIYTSDRILVIDDGQIAEQGTHAELYAAAGQYRRLHDLQLAGPLQAMEVAAAGNPVQE